MSKLSWLVIVLGICLLLSQVSFGQSLVPNSGDIFEEVDDVPIDGAIALLTIAGAGLGIKKLFRKRVK